MFLGWLCSNLKLEVSTNRTAPYNMRNELIPKLLSLSEEVLEDLSVQRTRAEGAGARGDSGAFGCNCGTNPWTKKKIIEE